MEKDVVSRQAMLAVVREYWLQYKKHPFYSLVGFLFPAIGTILVFFVPPLIIAGIINEFNRSGEIGLASVSGYILIFGGLWLVGEACWRLGRHFIIKIEAEGIKSLAETVFRKLLERDYSFYANNYVGSLTKKSLAFPRNFELFTDTMLFNIVTNIFPIIFALIILWSYSPLLPLTLILSLTIAFSVGLPMIRRRSKLVALRHEAGSRMAGRLSDSISNMPAIKSFAAEKLEEESYDRYNTDWTDKYKNANDYQNLKFEMVMSPIYVFTNLAGLVVAIYVVQQLGLEAGIIVVVFSYFAQISNIFWQMSRVYRMFESAITESAEFMELVIAPPAVRDKKGAGKLKVTKAKIEFKNISFKYSDADQDEESFLNDFNLEISSNQKIGLVGPSGGGKTTITKLLLRYIDYQSGQILIDGQNISEVTQDTLRKNIAYVPQEPLLFHRSLAENIGYGKENADMDEIIEASKLAHAHEFIEKLPKGYDTLVGERGIKLSGGQRQRVAIARALLKNAPILVLDEATSSLDSESEKFIQRGLLELMKDKTALVIAHRLSTIKHLDRIIVLDNGKIVETGTHDELLQRNGLYARLWSHQTGEFIND